MSLKEFMFDFDTSDIRYSESRKPAEVAAYMSQNPSVRLGIDGYTYFRAAPSRRLTVSRSSLA